LAATVAVLDVQAANLIAAQLRHTETWSQERKICLRTGDTLSRRDLVTAGAVESVPPAELI
jgi:hypothetical protein